MEKSNRVDEKNVLIHSMFNDNFEKIDELCVAEHEDILVMLEDAMEERKSKIPHKTFR